jgi:hypothetical protein
MLKFEIVILIATWIGSLHAQLGFDSAFYHPNGTCKNLMRPMANVSDDAVIIDHYSFTVFHQLKLSSNRNKRYYFLIG